MNANKYLNSRLGKTIEQIKKAYVSDKHICFLVCSEPEFLQELIASASFFPNHKPIKGEASTSVKFVDTDNFIVGRWTENNKQEIEKPLLYIYSQNNAIDSGKLPMSALVNYVNHITSLNSCNVNLTEGQEKKITYLQESLIVIPVSAKPDIPTYIEPYSVTIEVPFMAENEFKEYVSTYLAKTEGANLITDGDYSFVQNGDYLKRLYRQMLCLNASQIKTILGRCQMALGRIYYERDNQFEDKIKMLISNIKHEFAQLINTSRALTLEEPSPEEPAGLTNIVKWMDNHKSQVSSPEMYEQYMMNAPKGLLISGIPGSGKSMMAKYVANALGLSLLKFDFGNVGGKYVGESEKNMDEALELIEAFSPCVLWIDEIEKAFAGMNDNSHETSKRNIGKFLTWLQERCSCFVFATSNDVSKMPPELFRSGRFDDKFFTFMPSAKECVEIFRSTLKYQNKQHKARECNNNQYKPLFNIAQTTQAFERLIKDRQLCLKGFPEEGLSDRGVNRRNKFFTGADINQLIDVAKKLYIQSDSIYIGADAIFNVKKFGECLKEALKGMKTYGETNLEQIAKCYSQLASNNFNSASKDMLLPFEGYGKLDYIIGKANKDADEEQVFLYDYNRIGDKSEEKYYNELESDYDKCLYVIVRNTINALADEIIL